MDRVSQYQAVQNEAIALFKKKNNDYGDSFVNFGPVGVIIRMGDKINRLSSITNSSINLVKTESIRDTLIDLHNYAAMAIMLMDEKQNIKKNDNKVLQQINNTFQEEEEQGHELSDMEDLGSIFWGLDPSN